MIGWSWSSGWGRGGAASARLGASGVCRRGAARSPARRRACSRVWSRPGRRSTSSSVRSARASSRRRGVLVGDDGQLVAARGGEADVAGAGVGLVLVPDDEAVLLEAGERPADDRGRHAGRLREVTGTVLAGLRGEHLEDRQRGAGGAELGLALAGHRAAGPDQAGQRGDDLTGGAVRGRAGRGGGEWSWAFLWLQNTTINPLSCRTQLLGAGAESCASGRAQALAHTTGEIRGRCR